MIGMTMMHHFWQFLEMMLSEIILICDQQMLRPFWMKRRSCQFFCTAFAYTPPPHTHTHKCFCYFFSDLIASKLSQGCSFNFWRMYKHPLLGLLSHQIFWIWSHCVMYHNCDHFPTLIFISSSIFGVPGPLYVQRLGYWMGYKSERAQSLRVT